MNLRQIEAFRSVMRLGSMTAAAEVLFTSQPNVSRLISQLEESIGLTLFKRAGVRLIPTQEVRRSFMKWSGLMWGWIRSSSRPRTFATWERADCVWPPCRRWA